MFNFRIVRHCHRLLFATLTHGLFDEIRPMWHWLVNSSLESFGIWMMSICVLAAMIHISMILWNLSLITFSTKYFLYSFLDFHWFDFAIALMSSVKFLLAHFDK